MKIVISSDHAGYKLKEEIKPFLKTKTETTEDLGPFSESPVDFPDYALRVAELVSRGEADFGIMIDGVGSSSAIVCNKLPGIRASVVYNEFSSKIAKEHSNANILCLGSKSLGADDAIKILDTFFSAEFLGGKYKNRLQKVEDIENKYLIKPDKSSLLKKKLVTETDLRESKRAGTPILLSKSMSKFTPSALEFIEKNSDIITWEP
ncbi:MAG: RpiB/LacA/LacB family sugar-phosphate isomerase [Candidatus Hydrogenedentota bacterium]